MRRFLVCIALALASTALLASYGCGGGGASSATSRAPLNVYVTDGFSDAYKQVLITFYKIELSIDGTSYTTVFSDTAGQTIDLRSLSTTAQLLASLNVPTGTYTSARITFGDHITLVANDGTSSSVAVASSAATIANGQAVLTVTTPTKVTGDQAATLLVDFKLAEFQLVGGTLRPSVSCGGDGQIGSKQRVAHISGTVANLVDGTSFTLQGPNGGTITVDLTSTTTITSGQTGAVITLTNGQNVMVEGTLDAAGTTITATSVTLNDYTHFPHEEASGTVASIDSTTTSFVLTVARAHGIPPTGGTIKVVTDANTVILKGRHQTAAFSDIAVTGTVEVGGTFDTTTQTLTARYVHLF